MRLSALAVFSLSALAGAQDWAEFRGPTAMGTVVGKAPPTQWGEGKNIVWKKALPGNGWSSPIILDGKIFLTTAVPAGSGPVAKGKSPDQSLRALCLDARSGDIVWNTEVFTQDGATAPRIHGKNSHASPTPISDGKHVYVQFGHMGTAALDLQGKILWRCTELKYQPVHGNGGSPVIIDDLLVFSCDGGSNPFVAALKRDTGKVAWKTPRNIQGARSFSFSTPLIIEVTGKKQVVLPGSGMVAAYEPATGAEIWRVRYGTGYSVVPRPVFGNGLVFVCTGYDTAKLYAIKPDGKGDVTDTHVAWTATKQIPLNPSPLLIGTELYTISDNGIATCFDAKTGNVHWTQRIGGNHSSSPIGADGKIWFLSEDGTATVIKAGTKFEQIARNVMGERSLASYAVGDGALFVRTAAGLYRIAE